MFGLLSAMIEPVAKVLLKAWLGDSTAEIGGGLIKYARNVLADGKKAADAVQLARRIATGLVADLGTAMEHEGLDACVIETAAVELGETLGTHLDTGFLIGLSLNPTAVSEALLRARPIEQVFAPSEPEYAAYRIMVGLLAERLCKFAPDLPDYTRERDSVLLARMSEVARDVPAVLARVVTVQATVTKVLDDVAEFAGREERQRTGYAADYCRAVSEKLDYVEILGLPDLGPESREAKLSVAYLSLTTTIPGVGRLSFEDLLDVLPFYGGRLLIEGAAGSGKSTLLRWTAVQAASTTLPTLRKPTLSMLPASPRQSAQIAETLQMVALVEQAFPDGKFSSALIGRRPMGLDIETFLNQAREDLTQASGHLPITRGFVSRSVFDTNFRGAWRNAIPFQIRLRHIEGGLPEPDDLPRHLSTALGGPPEGWVREQLKSGNALLLIDGVDEVPEGEPRQAAQQGIRDYLDAYPNCLTIVTSRPGACDKLVFRDLGFVDAEINELSDEQRAAFIDTWHRAFADRTAQPVEGTISDLARELKERLAGQPQIARLATNPLLCAGICALHERSGQSLPKNEWDLCAKLTEMLADQRDRAPGRQGGMSAEPVGQVLNYPVRRSILARLADAMVSQQLSALPREDAVRHVAAALRGVREATQVMPERVLETLAIRSGVLRVAGIQGEETHDAVEFVHNTLRSWLASLHCLEENKPRELAALALVTQVTDVVVFAAAAPTHVAYANTLIAELIESAARQSSVAQRRALEVVALRCDAAAPSLDAALRGQLEELAAALFPPTTFEEAQSLAAMGQLAVPRLRFTSTLLPDAAACVRCLRLIATPSALSALQTFRHIDDMDTLEELAQIFDPLTLPAVVAATADYGKWNIIRPSIKNNLRSLETLTGRADIQSLYLSDSAITNLDPLSTLINLRVLDVGSTAVNDLSPIAGLTQLFGLYLDGTKIIDLSPLNAMQSVKTLWLGNSEPCSLQGVERLGSLTALRVIGLGVTDLGPITALGNLTDLWLHGIGTSDLSPVARLTGLTRLSISFCEMDDPSPVSGLFKLVDLDVQQTRVRDLTALANLPALSTLDISSCPVESLAAVRHLSNLQRLVAKRTPLSQSEIEDFRTAIPGRQVDWSPPPPDDTAGQPR
jgi:hypothetical protein